MRTMKDLLNKEVEYWDSAGRTRIGKVLKVNGKKSMTITNAVPYHKFVCIQCTNVSRKEVSWRVYDKARSERHAQEFGHRVVKRKVQPKETVPMKNIFGVVWFGKLRTLKEWLNG